MAGKFVIKKNQKKDYWFVLIAGNNEIIAVSEMYKTKQACNKGIQSVKENAPSAPIIDETEE